MEYDIPVYDNDKVLLLPIKSIATRDKQLSRRIFSLTEIGGNNPNSTWYSNSNSIQQD